MKRGRGGKVEKSEEGEVSKQVSKWRGEDILWLGKIMGVGGRYVGNGGKWVEGRDKWW